MNHTLDVTGLPQAVIEELQAIIDGYRKSPHANESVAKKRQQSPDQWIADFQAMVNSKLHRKINMDDSRESIYEGCGE